jgi:hypothetical protein
MVTMEYVPAQRRFFFNGIDYLQLIIDGNKAKQTEIKNFHEPTDIYFDETEAPF